MAFCFSFELASLPIHTNRRPSVSMRKTLRKKLKLQQVLLFSVALLFSQTFKPSRRQENPLLRMRQVKLTRIYTWNVFLSLWGPFVLHSRRLYSPKTPLIRLTRTKRFWWQFATQLWSWVSFSFLAFFMTMRKLWLLLLMIVFSEINRLVIKRKNVFVPLYNIVTHIISTV